MNVLMRHDPICFKAGPLLRAPVGGTYPTTTTVPTAPAVDTAAQHRLWQAQAEAMRATLKAKRYVLPAAVTQAHPELVRALGPTLVVEDFHEPAMRDHLADLALVPANLYARLRQKGLKQIHIANRPVPYLGSKNAVAGLAPRGWQDGSTFDIVPGAYVPAQKAVLAGGGNHGSLSLALHELGHAVGERLGYLKHPALKAAHERLYAKLPNYLQQGGPGGKAGRDELFAEAFAVLVQDGEAVATERYDAAFVRFLKVEVLGV